ncbi:Trm112 family protein [Maridesulfovibrio sp.]|uniref:Trm112 family protein n=1 Tax=Maridesulfovibrio sp. TaxID=2795000 RepID=UPI0029CAA1B1|nr:Trm112 family protein [Maridesulfovibrio sp.]
MTLNKELIDILVCPKCKGELNLLEGETGLECENCKVVYPVKDEIPIMLADDAVPADKWEKK